MFTKKEHNMRVVLRETLSGIMDEDTALVISNAIETDVFHEVMVNGRYADKFSEDEIRHALGKVLCARLGLGDVLVGRTFRMGG